jgi:hypothetical protein
MDKPSSSIKAVSDSIKTQVSELKGKLKEYILSLPDMVEGVHPISNNSCIISFSVLIKNQGIMTPAYYMNHETKKAILAMIDKTSIENLNKKIETLVSTGKLPVGYSSRFGHQAVTLNPAFVEKVKELWFGNTQEAV